jgi:hypothetical protein
MSTQIVIIHAINSSEFNEVLSRQSIGISNRHASPEVMLYPPKPNSEASDRYIFVGFLYTILLMEIPSLAMSKNDIVRCKSVFSVMDRLVQPCFVDLIRAWRSLLRKCRSIGITVAV